MSGKLTELSIRKLTRDGVKCRTRDSLGLYLDVRAPGRGQWVYRYSLEGRAREIGLGSAGGVDDAKVADVRAEAASLRRIVKSGVHPRDAEAESRRAAAEAEAIAAAALIANSRAFKAVAEEMLAQHELAWRNEKHRMQWRNTLKTYAYPVLGHLPVSTVTTEHLIMILSPIWAIKPETASRIRGRIERVLAYAKAQGWRSGDNPAVWRGHLDTLLASPHKLKRSRHHPALPWRQMNEFMPALRSAEGIAARALEFTILTAARSGEVRQMTWGEVDIDTSARVWIVPAERMKAQKTHRVPLSARAAEVLRAARVWRLNDAPSALVFPGLRGRPLSDMTLSAVLRRMKGEGGSPRWVDGRGDAVTVHGYRSSFRDWAGECHGAMREIAEMSLAHTVGGAVERSYFRSDLFEQRRALMDAWASYCSS